MKYIFQGIMSICEGINSIFDRLFYPTRRSQRIEEIIKRAREPVTWGSMGSWYNQPNTWGKNKKPK